MELPILAMASRGFGSVGVAKAAQSGVGSCVAWLVRWAGMGGVIGVGGCLSMPRDGGQWDPVEGIAWGGGEVSPNAKGGDSPVGDYLTHLEPTKPELNHIY